MNRRHLLAGMATGAVALGFWRLGLGEAEAEAAYPFALTDAQWRQRLSPLAYNVLRKQATEHPFTSPLDKEKRAGIFACAGATKNCSARKPSLTAAPAGRASTRRCPRRSAPVATLISAIHAPRFIARVVAGIWAMCSMMGQGRQASAIA